MQTGLQRLVRCVPPPPRGSDGRKGLRAKEGGGRGKRLDVDSLLVSRKGHALPRETAQDL